MKYQIIKRPTEIKELGKILMPNEVYLIKSPNIISNNLYTIEEHLFYNYIHDLDKDKVKNVFVVCGGGIGDIIMHSSLCDMLKDKNIHFVTNMRYKDIFQWFTKSVNIIDNNRPLLKDFTLHNKMTKYKNYRYVNTVERYFKSNEYDWFELIFRLLGINQIPVDYLRPHLHTRRISDKPSNIKHDNALLIHNKSTAMMRNIDFMTIYNAIPDTIKKKYTLYAHVNNLSPDDLKMPLKDVHIIKADTLSDFFLDLYDASEVITVDSNPSHFREGIQKHAICLFNSFPSNIRTKYYQYVNSYDIKSECELQPCCLHKSNIKQYCDKADGTMFAAPCFTPMGNKYLIEELRTIFENTL